jgi:hypothetical protein
LINSLIAPDGLIDYLLSAEQLTGFLRLRRAGQPPPTFYFLCESVTNAKNTRVRYSERHGPSSHTKADALVNAKRCGNFQIDHYGLLV